MNLNKDELIKRAEEKLKHYKDIKPHNAKKVDIDSKDGLVRRFIQTARK